MSNYGRFDPTGGMMAGTSMLGPLRAFGGAFSGFGNNYARPSYGGYGGGRGPGPSPQSWGGPSGGAGAPARGALSQLQRPQYSSQQINDYINTQGIGNDPMAMWHAMQQYGVNPGQMDAARGWAPGTAQNWINQQQRPQAPTPTPPPPQPQPQRPQYSNQQINDYINTQGIGNNPAAMWQAMKQFNVDPSQMDAARGWAPGTAQNWINQQQKPAAPTQPQGALSQLSNEDIRNYLHTTPGMQATTWNPLNMGLNWDAVQGATKQYGVDPSRIDSALHLDPGMTARQFSGQQYQAPPAAGTPEDMAARGFDGQGMY